MRVVEKPSIIHEDILKACTSNIRNQDLKQRVEEELNYFNDSTEKYNNIGDLGKLSQIQSSDTVNDAISKEEMLFLYKKLSSKGEPARKYYDILLHASKICPFCGYRISGTLDHYLPKARFPEFSVNPLNLIPCCRDCNSAKLTNMPSNEEETLHPYYDNVEQGKWLFAEIDYKKEIGFSFFVQKPENWTDRKFQKLHNHFNALKLSELYSIIASQEFNDQAHFLKKLYIESGSEILKDTLLDFKKSSERHYVNNWKSAMYEALAESNWFCNEGIANFPV
ncbi:HNH endonuclease signature motif containing protein [Gracilibacillus sp. S3-1-1]|uniref:HNH endonuclease signature motif containing protein n=1 Tax=Gracilibacillus pellucidus TaxID=3095368 RepID=A0ACC6M6U7_9BACI|nr:HNH endonuclease signature motif containing protein [Gracilibacillus sp. S3-1-1]MDX8046621.1 HNH endonuclease signature motif containing protein [Gracilibacillus sp. S3-1-1]